MAHPPPPFSPKYSWVGLHSKLLRNIALGYNYTDCKIWVINIEIYFKELILLCV